MRFFLSLGQDPGPGGGVGVLASTAPGGGLGLAGGAGEAPEGAGGWMEA